ncbi:hypothetical protein HG530_000984 [Fusarium avenaceum]|nr:hypothetical protein HG530_000984 [Fusarium avenaceum]
MDSLVAVATPLPTDRTAKGNSSLCIHGTLPRPSAYAATYIMMLMRIVKAAISCPAVAGGSSAVTEHHEWDRIQKDSPPADAINEPQRSDSPKEVRNCDHHGESPIRLATSTGQRPGDLASVAPQTPL